MKQLDYYIQEKLKISSKSKINHYNYFPKDRDELKKLVDKLIEERGNNADLNDIDTSEITDICTLFYSSNFNGDISKWDVSKVKDMSYMFYDSNFNGDISKWNVSNVEYMRGMFWNCRNFNGNISEWDVSKVKDMKGMFKKCPLEKNPPKWYKI